MKPEPTTRLLFAGFALATALLGSVGWLEWRHTLRMEETAGWVAHTYKVQASRNLLYSLVLEIEIGQRSFVLTGQSVFLEMFEQATNRVMEETRKLEAMIQAEEQKENLAVFKALIAERIDFASRTVELRKNGETETATREIARLKGKELTDQIRAQLAVMEARAGRLLQQRSAAALREGDDTRRLLAAGNGLSLALFIAVFALMRREYRLRQQEHLDLAASEENLAVTLHSIGEAVLATDAAGRVTQFNTVAETLTGWAQAEAVGRPVAEVFRVINEETRQPAFLPVADTLAKGTMHGPANHSVLIARDGTERRIADSCAPIRHRGGPVIGAVLVFRDVTTEHKAQDELERFFALTPDMIAIADFTGRFRRVSPSFERILGHSSKVLLERPFADFIHPEDLAATRAEMAKLSSGIPTLHFENRYRCADGAWRTVSWVATAVVKQGLIYCSGRDVSEQRRAEETLRQTLDELHRANGEVHKASRHKDEFLANMSHELRTPLNAILGLSEALLEQVSGPLTPRQVKSLTTISTSGQHLLELINDILDLSKIEAGKMELIPDTVSIHQLCESCLVFVRTQATQKRIDVAFEHDRRVAALWADPKRLKQILVNLLTNAVKFTPEGGRIGLTVAAPEGENAVRFTVWDTGIGIALADSAKLFKAFTQIDSGLSRSQEGTGLGLALVAKLVELHGGSVALESEPGKGSRFMVTLPQTASTAPLAPANELVDRSNYRRALIIEDDGMSGALLGNYLTELGLSSALHVRGEEPIEAALRERPDVILLDILLPNETGWVVLAKLKDHPATRDIPVVVISAVDEPQKSLALGAAVHFTRPLTRAQLAAFFQHPGPRHAAPATQRLHRALVIEDDPTAGEQLVRYLTELGLSSVLRTRGEQSVEAVLRERPDVILLDVQLPGESGWVVLTRLREHPQTRDVPVVIITVMDEPQKSRALGAAAHFTKPVTREGLAAFFRRATVSHPLRALPPAPVGHSILLAEDNEGNIQTIGGYLEDKGYAMHYAKNGLAAVKLARELRPALILMDIQMPVMDGLAAMKEIRADAALKNIPIVALTALAMPGDRECCLAAGATDYLSKPVSLKALSELVKRVTGGG